jgi:hypothetical protein
VLASWAIVVAHLSEVLVWAAFFVWRDAMPSLSAAFYFALLQHVTVGNEQVLRCCRCTSPSLSISPPFRPHFPSPPAVNPHGCLSLP